MVEDGQLQSMAGPRGYAIPSHILYVDDILLMCRGTQRNLKNLMRLFNDYGEASGQLINPAKSKFYTGCISAKRKAINANSLWF